MGIAITTTSSAAALPKALEGMEQYGLNRQFLGLVMPLGLSFNSAGSSIQLMMGVLFVAQAACVALGWGQMLMVFLTMKLAAKGVAGIPRANFVILSATLPGFGLPLDTLPLLLAVDGIIDMVRTPVNVMGIVWPRWCSTRRWGELFRALRKVAAFVGIEFVGAGESIEGIAELFGCVAIAIVPAGMHNQGSQSPWRFLTESEEEINPVGLA